MAAATTTTLLKSHSQTILPKRRRFRETTITTTSQPPPSDTTTSRKLDTPTIVSPDNSWCCPATKLPPPPPPPVPSTHIATVSSSSSSTSSSPLNRKIRYSTITSHQQMDSYAAAAATVYNTAAHDSYPSSLSKFNNALTAGLLNPMSPPPPSADKTTRSSPTLFEMMANEPDNTHPKPPLQQNGTVPSHPHTQPHSKPSPLDKQALTQQRLTDLLTCKTPGNQFNDPISSDVKLTLSSKDNLSVQMSVHRQILVAHSRFFSEKLSDKWVKQQRHNGPYIVEIADCDDIEVYIETLKLMYCKDLRKKLMKEDVPKVLGILRVSAAIGFDAGVLSCLEYLEAAPWSEEEEEKVASLLSELQLEGSGSCEVLKRVSLDTQNGSKPENEEILLKLIQVVLEGKDEKARREMKTLVSKMLRENSSNLRKESLYSAIEKSLGLFRTFFNLAANGDLTEVSKITREADNLHWILDILIDKQMAEDFLKIWGSEINLSEVHSKVPAVHRYEISKVTARLFIGIGKGQLMASKDSRCLLIQTWLVPFYDDFAWMRRASKGLDRHLIEEGLSNTILTLPMCWQKEIFMSWFDRFLNCSDDCPNIQRGFEIWWRRAFSGRNCEVNLSRQMRIMNGTIENS